MPQNPGQQRAADAVAAELADRNWTNVDLSTATGDEQANKSPVDLGTIGDFLKYERWPKTSTQGRIEQAFGWPAGTIRLISLGKAERPSARATGLADPSIPDPFEMDDDSEAIEEFIRQRRFRRGQRDVSAGE